MKKSNSILAKPLIRILLSVVLLVLCFLMNRYFNIQQTPWNLLQYVLSLVLIVIPFYGIIMGISQMLTDRKEPPERSGFDPEHPIKIWTHAELFAYLEQEDIIDLDIDHEVVHRIGTSSDYRQEHRYEQGEYFDKLYYIDDAQYADFNEFKKLLYALHPENEIRILRASMDDGNTDIILP